jgi:anti-sigma B factor antagonist
MPLQVDTRTEAGIKMIRTAGTLDSSNMNQVKAILIEIREAPDAPRVVMDLAPLDFISSMGWAMFVNFAIEFKKRGGGLKFAGMNDRMERLYWLMGVNAQVEHFKDVNEAIKSFS